MQTYNSFMAILKKMFVYGPWPGKFFLPDESFFILDFSYASQLLEINVKCIKQLYFAQLHNRVLCSFNNQKIIKL